MEQEEIDAIAEQFDESWEPQLPLSRIFNFDPIQGIKGTGLSPLLLELAMIDVERRWMLFKSMLSEETSPEALDQMLEGIPTSTDYVETFNAEKQIFGEEAQLELQIHDFSVRAQLGDLPTPNPGIPAYVIDEVKPYRPEVSVTDGGTDRFRCSTWGRIEVGRQNPPEPSPYRLVTLPDRSKLICAEASNSRISRNQVAVQVFALQFARLQNPSQNRHLIFRTESRTEPLAPGDQCLVSLPLTVHLDAIEISFRIRL